MIKNYDLEKMSVAELELHLENIRELLYAFIDEMETRVDDHPDRVTRSKTDLLH